MDVVVSFVQRFPPVGSLRVPGGEPVPFTGRLGLLQAIADVLAAGPLAAFGEPVEVGRELDPRPEPELAQHVRDVRGDGVVGDD